MLQRYSFYPFYYFYPSSSGAYTAVLILNQLFRVLNERLVVLNCYLKLARRFGYSGCGKKRAAVVVKKVRLLRLGGVRRDDEIIN